MGVRPSTNTSCTARWHVSMFLSISFNWPENVIESVVRIPRDLTANRGYLVPWVLNRFRLVEINIIKSTSTLHLPVVFDITYLGKHRQNQNQNQDKILNIEAIHDIKAWNESYQTNGFYLSIYVVSSGSLINRYIAWSQIVYRIPRVPSRTFMVNNIWFTLPNCMDEIIDKLWLCTTYSYVLTVQHYSYFSHNQCIKPRK